jgi:hypothetical protein
VFEKGITTLREILLNRASKRSEVFLKGSLKLKDD